MSCALNLDHLTTAFSSGRLNGRASAIDFEVQPIGELCIGSGAVVATDPLVVPDQRPFLQTVPNGRFPVDLAIARFDNEDERIAFARVTFNAGPTVAWQMAVTAEQDPAAIHPPGHLGYSVDSGTACFMDARAGELLARRMHADQQFFNAILGGMEHTYRHTRSWVAFRPSADHEVNCLCFSSGFGDGSYPSFFGFDANGQVTTLVTDFGVLAGRGDPIAPSERRTWWQKA